MYVSAVSLDIFGAEYSFPQLIVANSLTRRHWQNNTRVLTVTIAAPD